MRVAFFLCPILSKMGFYNIFKLSLAEVPARYPVVQAAWKLNPPVMPSIFNTSPAK